MRHTGRFAILSGLHRESITSNVVHVRDPDGTPRMPRSHNIGTQPMHGQTLILCCSLDSDPRERCEPPCESEHVPCVRVCMRASVCIDQGL